MRVIYLFRAQQLIREHFIYEYETQFPTWCRLPQYRSHSPTMPRKVLLSYTGTKEPAAHWCQTHNRAASSHEGRYLCAPPLAAQYSQTNTGKVIISATEHCNSSKQQPNQLFSFSQTLPLPEEQLGHFQLRGERERWQHLCMPTVKFNFFFLPAWPSYEIWQTSSQLNPSTIRGSPPFPVFPQAQLLAWDLPSTLKQPFLFASHKPKITPALPSPVLPALTPPLLDLCSFRFLLFNRELFHSFQLLHPCYL